LPLAGRIADAENQIAGGNVYRRPAHVKRSGNHVIGGARGESLNPLLDLAYAQRLVKAGGGGQGGQPWIDEKRLYICAGFDDYPIATLVRRRGG
jgi:hypothetical protein